MYQIVNCLTIITILCSCILAQNLSWEKSYIRKINGLVYAPVSKLPYTGEVFELDETGNVIELVVYKDGLPDGEPHYVEWYRNGQKKEERNFVIGDNDGYCNKWYKSGQKKEKQVWKSGKKHGIWTLWYANGQKEYEGNYIEGEKDGKWSFWYESGQKKQEGSYKKNRLYNGIYTEWFPNGQKKMDGSYKSGKKDGEWTSLNVYDDEYKIRYANINGGIEKAQELASSKMGAITGGLNIPGLT